jgi:putative peptidoglycan lipid II flippase
VTEPPTTAAAPPGAAGPGAAGDGPTGAGSRRIGAAALLLSVSVVASLLLGFVREAVLAYRVGAGGEVDAYKAAFQIPDWINYLLAGGALSVAFIPLYTRRCERGEAEAERLLGVVLGTAFVAVTALTAALWWWTPALVDLAFAGFDAETRALTARLTRIVMPAQVFIVIGSILRGVLMARGSFGAQAAAPLIYNACIIAGGLLLAPRMGVEGFSWGCLVGAALGPFLLPLWDVRRRGLRLRPRVSLTDRDFVQYVMLAAPLTLGVTLLTVDEWYDRLVGNHLAEGTIALLFYARLLMQVPIRVVGQATATAAMPTLSRLFAEGDATGLNRTLLDTLRVAVGVAVLAATGLAVLADPVVRVVYERGAFGADDGAAVAAILRIMTLAVPAWVIQQIAVRGFYAREQMWSPMLLGTAVALLAIPLYVALGREAGVEGLAAAGALAIWVNALATVALGRRLHAAPDLAPLVGSFVRAGGIAAAAGLAASAAPAGDASLGGALLHLALGGVAFGAVTLAGVAVVGDAPLRRALRRLLPGALRRLVPGRGPSS